ncbi:TrmB family transcriptional regulator [Haloprofundus halobius]|uniref:TrmB family transcriptional regulator n=1 Tax=Haloprofundus halobius TaxID=2876194 RepID=UPI001CCF3EE5|nr:TrmB family transcriptional regulator sugar-binding domain-containing protein [Haloprofundus halobius]
MAKSDRNGDTELRRELKLFGLSEKEVDAYLAILARGEVTTRTVSQDTDITQRAVYNIAERLESRGFVRVKDHASPTTIRAISPREAIGALSERLEAITPALERQFNETEPQSPEIQIVKSRETAIKRFKNAISRAEEELIVLVPEYVLDELEPSLRDAVDRGVFVLLSLGGLDASDADADRFDGVASIVRHWNEELPFLYTADNRFAMVGDSGMLAGTHADGTAVEVEQSNLTGTVQGLHLGTYWPASKTLYVAEPDPLPTRFSCFRHAVFQATLHMRNGVELRADIETESGGHLSGSVSQIRQGLLEPVTNEFTLETNFRLETGDGEVSVGGRGSFIEDQIGATVTLYEA